MPSTKSHISFLLTLLAIVWGVLLAADTLRAQWSNPTAVPPNNNPASFLTTGINSESKSGVLTLTNNFYVIGSGLVGKVGIGTSTIESSSRLVVEPYTNASIDAGAGSIRTSWQAAHNDDVINKSYLTSTLNASIDSIKYWTLSGNNLYASSTAYNIAIGTTTAGTAKLAVIGGNVGIGTNKPGAALHVSDEVLIGGTSLKYTNQYKLQVTGTNKGIYIGMPGLPADANSNNAFSVGVISELYSRGNFYSNGTYGIGGGTAARDVFIGRSAVNTMKIGSNYALSGSADLLVTGNVGIGTTTPDATLHVVGNVIADTPVDSKHLATKGYVDTAAQSLWVNSGNYLYASSTSWRVGIGTTSPASALHIYPQTGIEGLRIVSSNFSPLVISKTDNSDDLFRVNQFGDVTAVTSSATKMRSNNYCDASGNNCFDPSSGWSTEITTIFLTSTTINGNFVFTGGFVGYDAGNKICNSQQAGSHFCRTDEIMYLIQKNGASSFSSINGQDAWIADGPPGFTGAVAADDCSGWTNGTTSYLGHFWIFNSSGGGKGALINCATTKKIACCK